jgi:endonuclease YncB( thermonuclease family)
MCLVTSRLGATTLGKLDQNSADDMIPALVTRVLDATTIEARLEQGSTERVRLLGIAAVACYEVPALRRLIQLARGRHAALELRDDSRDRAGRLYGYLWVGERLINEQLVAEGAAMPLEVQPSELHSDELAAAAKRARNKNLGLWSECAPSDGGENGDDADLANENFSEPRVAISTNPGGPRRVAPISTWECPVTHPIKAAVTEGGQWVYTRANRPRGPRIKPLACFATESDAQQAGYHFIGD